VNVGGRQDRGIIMFFMTFSGGRKTSMFRARTDSLTHSRTHVIALIHPCDSRQSERGSSNPSHSLILFLTFFLSASLSVSSLATVVATQQAGFQTNKTVREKNARFSTVQSNIHAVIKTKCSWLEPKRETACSYIFIKYLKSTRVSVTYL